MREVVWHTESVFELLPLEVTDAQHDTVLERLLERLPDAVRVDPAGAQNGPMLNVARCVPLMDARGDDDAAEGDTVLDTRAVAI